MLWLAILILLKVFSGTSNADDEVSTYNPDINNEDRIQDRFDVDSEESGAQSKLKRRKKKEVLEARNVDIDEVCTFNYHFTISAVGARFEFFLILSRNLVS